MTTRRRNPDKARAEQEDDLRRRVHDQLHAALAQERTPLTASSRDSHRR